MVPRRCHGFATIAALSVVNAAVTLDASAEPPAAAEDVGSVSVALDRGALVATVDGPAGLAVPSCRGVVFERFDETSGRFVVEPGEACGALSPALLLGGDSSGLTGELRFRGPTMPPGTQVVRAVGVVGEGCMAGQPLALAGCKTLRSISSQPFTLPGSAGR